MFQYFQILFIVIFLVIFTIAKIQKKNIAYLKQDIFNFTVIPSLAIASSGHLFFGSQIRKGMGWDNSIGTVTLETELGITQLAMFIIACIPRTSPEYIGSLWGLMLVMMGINHFIVKKEFSFVGVLDIIYGGLLIALFSPSLFTKKSRHERNVTDLSTSMTTPCVKDGEQCHASGDTCCITNQPCTTRKCPSGSTPPSPPGKVPTPIKGYYFWSWTNGNPPQKIVKGPPGSNIGITFPGVKASGQNPAWLVALKNPPQTDNEINLLSIGGGQGSDGLQSFNNEDIVKTISLLPTIKKQGYNGICFDIESGNATIADYKNLFTQTKKLDLIVMVTISYFATSSNQAGLGDIINDLVQQVFTNTAYVDILSPQLYSGDCDDSDKWPVNAGGDFNGNGPTNATRNAYKNCKFLAPTINSSNWTSIKAKWSGLGLPKPIGYFQYCDKYIN